MSLEQEAKKIITIPFRHPGPTVVVVLGAAYVASRMLSPGGETTPQQIQPPIGRVQATPSPVPSPDFPPTPEKEWVCETVQPGDHPLGVIRKLGKVPGIYHGRYRYTKRLGERYLFNNWRDFPTIFSGETICVEGGTIYQSPGAQVLTRQELVKSQIRESKATSSQIQAKLRSTHGF